MLTRSPCKIYIARVIDFLRAATGVDLRSYSAVVAAPGREAGNRSVLTGARTSATVGGYLRGGADFQFARSFTIGVDAGHNWVADFAQPVGVRTNYSGFGMGVGLGVLFGRSTAARP